MSDTVRLYLMRVGKQRPSTFARSSSQHKAVRKQTGWARARQSSEISGSGQQRRKVRLPLLAMHSLPRNLILINERQVTAPVPPTSCSSWQSNSSFGTMSNAASTSAPPQVRSCLVSPGNEFVSMENSFSPTIRRLLVAGTVAEAQVRRRLLLRGDSTHADPSPTGRTSRRTMAAPKSSQSTCNPWRVVDIFRADKMLDKG